MCNGCANLKTQLNPNSEEIGEEIYDAYCLVYNYKVTMVSRKDIKEGICLVPDCDSYASKLANPVVNDYVAGCIDEFYD